MVRYQDALTYLNSFRNYEKQSGYSCKKSFSLERVQKLFFRLGIEYEKLKVIHLAGTKGKGSTAAFVANILAASGYSVGLYTSPHLFDLRERIVVNQKNIPRKEFVKIIREFKSNLEKSKVKKNITYFEVLTAISFRYFLEKKVDFAVVETGLGGRLDATNLVSPLVSILTLIDYDHTLQLGKKIENIAFEKAGIIKKACPVVSCAQRSSVLKIMRRYAALRQAKLYVANKDFFVKNLKVSSSKTSFDFSFGKLYKNISLFVKGLHQVDNASLAIAAVLLLKDRGCLGKKINFALGLKHTFIPGRFQVIKRNPLTIVDVAHNFASFKTLSNALNLYYSNKKVILIFAAAKDKDIFKMLSVIGYEQLILTRYSSARCALPEQIRDKLTGKNIYLARNLKSAYTLAKGKATAENVIVIAGSFNLAAEAKNL